MPLVSFVNAYFTGATYLSSSELWCEIYRTRRCAILWRMCFGSVVLIERKNWWYFWLNIMNWHFTRMSYEMVWWILLTETIIRSEISNQLHAQVRFLGEIFRKRMYNCFWRGHATLHAAFALLLLPNLLRLLLLVAIAYRKNCGETPFPQVMGFI